MPELPEVETVRRGLMPSLVGRRITGVDVRQIRLRSTVDAHGLRRSVLHREIVAVRRRAKYLLLDLAGGGSVLLHLGMTGRLTLREACCPIAVHDHVIFRLDDGRVLVFNDARRFGLVQPVAPGAERRHPRLRHLGPEPLDNGFNAESLGAVARGSSRSVKDFIMDGTRVGGIGNIYACESLFAAGIHPARRVGGLSARRREALVHAIKSTLGAAIQQGGTTLRDFADPDGQAGLFAVQLSVYGREGEPCRRCGRPIRRIVQSGRSTYYCTGCQH